MSPWLRSTVFDTRTQRPEKKKERTIHCHKCLEGVSRKETDTERKDHGHTYHPHHPASVAKICYERRVRSLVCMCGSVDWSVSYLMFICLLLGSLLIGIPRCLCAHEFDGDRRNECGNSIAAKVRSGGRRMSLSGHAVTMSTLRTFSSGLIKSNMSRH